MLTKIDPSRIIFYLFSVNCQRHILSLRNILVEDTSSSGMEASMKQEYSILTV